MSRMSNRLLWCALAIAPLCLGVRAWAVDEGFTFSGADQKRAQEDADKKAKEADEIQALLSTPGGAGLKNKKTAMVIAERHEGRTVSQAAKYGPMYSEINQRLRRLGLKTYSQEEITAQIAQAQREAFFSNDPDSAISAASRLGASFFIKGLIESRAQVNPVAKVNEVHVTIAFTLVDSSGRVLASVNAENEAWSGSDTLSTALDLVREKADWVVAKLYGDYCRNAKR
ncbi:MAG: hypothetical protein HZB26_10810 [Candidatus Hydrogenedentes bacterium]|nr:hypothetical protein [Candidatus Hydrogenedentota bacterium]